ncbi:hypothetical protein ACLB2K_036873 [Fragaria x ananassa]
MNVRDYEARFSQLYHFAREMDAVDLARKFIRGLRHELRKLVTSHRFATLAETVESALAVEQEEAMHETERLRRTDRFNVLWRRLCRCLEMVSFDGEVAKDLSF